ILPLFPGLALWMAAAFNQMIAERDEKPGQEALRRMAYWASGFALLLMGVGIFFTVNMGRFLPREARHLSHVPANVLLVVALVVGLAVMSGLLWQRKALSAVTAQAALMALAFVIAFRSVVPEVNRATQGVMLQYVQVSGGQPLATLEIQRPS